MPRRTLVLFCAVRRGQKNLLVRAVRLKTLDLTQTPTHPLENVRTNSGSIEIPDE